MMQRTIKNFRTPVRGEQRKRINPESIPNNAQRKDSKGEQRLLPPRPEEHMAREQTCDEQNKARSNAAAFLGNSYCFAGERKNQTIPEINSLTERHHPGIDLRGCVLGSDVKCLGYFFRQR